MEIALLILGGLVMAPIAYNVLLENRSTLARRWCGFWRIDLISRRKRLRMALQMSVLVLVLGLPIGVGYALVGLALAPFPYGLLVVAGALLVYVVPLTIMGLGTNKRLLAMEKTFALEAAAQAVNLKTRDAEALLMDGLKEGSHYSLAAVVALRRLGTPESVRALEAAAADGPEGVRPAAAAVLATWAPYRGGSKGADSQMLESMLAAFVEARTKERLLQHRGDAYAMAREELETQHQLRIAAEQALDDVTDQQIALKQAFPALWCSACNARAVEVRRMLWLWVECRQCKGNADLVIGVKVAVGVLGPIPAGPHPDGELRVPLWDAKEKRALPAEIDVLEVVGGGDMDYDWAVAAVVETLGNQHWSFKYGIPCRLVGSPPLSANSLRILGKMTGPKGLTKG